MFFSKTKEDVKKINKDLDTKIEQLEQLTSRLCVHIKKQDDKKMVLTLSTKDI